MLFLPPSHEPEEICLNLLDTAPNFLPALNHTLFACGSVYHLTISPFLMEKQKHRGININSHF